MQMLYYLLYYYTVIVTTCILFYYIGISTQNITFVASFLMFPV